HPMPDQPPYPLPVPVNPSLPEINHSTLPPAPSLSDQMREAKDAWLTKSPSADTRSNYARDLAQFMEFAGLPENGWEHLAAVRPHHVNAWRDHLLAAGKKTENGVEGLTNHSVCRKLTVLRSLFSYLQSYGYSGINPAHRVFVKAPP